MYFDEAFLSGDIVNDCNAGINWMGINELITNKEKAGRLMGLADAEALRKILNRKK